VVLAPPNMFAGSLYGRSEWPKQRAKKRRFSPGGRQRLLVRSHRSAWLPRHGTSPPSISIGFDHQNNWQRLPALWVRLSQIIFFRSTAHRRSARCIRYRVRTMTKQSMYTEICCTVALPITNFQQYNYLTVPEHTASDSPSSIWGQICLPSIEESVS